MSMTQFHLKMTLTLYSIKTQKHFFLFSVFGVFKVEMWNISIKSMVSEHWICHKCVMEVEYITTCGIFLLKFGYLK